MRKQAKASNKQLKLSQESQQQTNNVIESDKYEWSVRQIKKISLCCSFDSVRAFTGGRVQKSCENITQHAKMMQIRIENPKFQPKRRQYFIKKEY